MLAGSAALHGARADDRSDLGDLRARIAELTANLERTRAEHREARDALRDTERAISDANRALARLEREATQVHQEIAELGTREARVKATIAQQQRTVGRLLVHRHTAGAPDALIVLLSGEDPAAVSRNLYYLSRLAAATGAAIGAFRANLAEFEGLRALAEQKAARLTAIEHAQREDRERVLAQRRTHRKLVAGIAQELRRSRQEIRVLRADEERLAKLVEGIGRLLEGARGRTTRISRTPERGAPVGPFESLRGQLRLPVRGELVGRYGAQTGAATAAKGLFIRAPAGQPVLAVAAGQVVFADWMRGFGNLLIIDHGDAYLSVYAYSDSLLKQVGEPVGPGERVATVGATGGRQESGLYFELRHLGRTFDPMQWVGAN